jgi:hypothetical protein
MIKKMIFIFGFLDFYLKKFIYVFRKFNSKNFILFVFYNFLFKFSFNMKHKRIKLII